jgi:hypothetical protein
MPNPEENAQDSERKRSENQARLKELGERIDEAEAKIGPKKPEADQGWQGDVA